MREEIEKLRDGLIAKADDVDNYDQGQFEVLTTVIRFLNTILANHPEKPSEGKETQKNGISEQCTALVRDHRIRMAGFAEGYAQGLEAAANFVDEAMHPVTSTANQLRDEAVRVRTEVAK